VESPTDPKVNRAYYNSKHGVCAFSFFIMVTPDGFIAYVSLVDTGNTHDAKAWNTAYAFPPVGEDGQERIDKKTLLKDLEEAYGFGKPESAKNLHIDERFSEVMEKEQEEVEVVGEERIFCEDDYTFAIGGDKAYPHISLVDGWSLFVTMTAGSDDAIKEAESATASSAEVMSQQGLDIPNFIHNINDNKQHHRHPKIARPRSVVERVIGAMKSYQILTNITFISKQKTYTVFKLIVIVAALCNYNLRLRGTSW